MEFLNSVCFLSKDEFLIWSFPVEVVYLSKARPLKVRNTDYSQWAGPRELFEREGGNDPDMSVWDDCALACSMNS